MKKSIIMIPALFIAVLVTIFFGHRYSAAQREDLDENQVTVSENGSKTEDKATEETVETEEKKFIEGSSENLLEDYELNSERLSLYEYLDYISLKNGQVTLAYYGDINTNESWVNEVSTAMRNVVSGDFNITDHSHPDYDSYELYIEQTTQALMDEKPDVIVYGLPALPDKMRDMGLAETEEFMGYTLDRLLTIEDTKLVLLEPYPVPGQINQLNSRSLDYRSYLSQMETVSENYDLTVIPLHSVFTAEASDESLETYFNETEELNEAGTQHVFSILDSLFNEEI